MGAFSCLSHRSHFSRFALATASSSEAETVLPLSLTGRDAVSFFPGDTATAGGLDTSGSSAFSSPEWAPTVGAGRRAMARRSFFPVQAPNTSGDLALMLAASPVRESRCEGTSVEQGTVPSRGTGRLGRLERQPTSSPDGRTPRLDDLPRYPRRPLNVDGIRVRAARDADGRPTSTVKDVTGRRDGHPIFSLASDPPEPMCDEINPVFGNNPNLIEDLT